MRARRTQVSVSPGKGCGFSLGLGALMMLMIWPSRRNRKVCGRPQC